VAVSVLRNTNFPCKLCWWEERAAMIEERYVASNRRPKGSPGADTSHYQHVTVMPSWYPPLISPSDLCYVSEMFPTATQVMGCKCSGRWPMLCGGTRVCVKLLVRWMWTARWHNTSHLSPKGEGSLTESHRPDGLLSSLYLPRQILRKMCLVPSICVLVSQGSRVSL
jgi:hypothetical protein